MYVGVDRKRSEHSFNGSRSVRSLAEGPKSDKQTWTNNAKRNVVDFDGESFRKEFPHELGTLGTHERPGFPAAYSPDRRSFISAAVTLDASAPRSIDWRALQTSRALILRAGAVERRLDSLAGFSIYALVWKPDSKRFAVVERNYDRTPRSPLAVIAPDGGSYTVTWS